MQAANLLIELSSADILILVIISAHEIAVFVSIAYSSAEGVRNEAQHVSAPRGFKAILARVFCRADNQLYFKKLFCQWPSSIENACD